MLTAPGEVNKVEGLEEEEEGVGTGIAEAKTVDVLEWRLFEGSRVSSSEDD